MMRKEESWCGPCDSSGWMPALSYKLWQHRPSSLMQKDMEPVLPVELIYTILNLFFPEDDVHTLTTCALVNREFLYASRGILFRTICISEEVTIYGYRE